MSKVDSCRLLGREQQEGLFLDFPLKYVNFIVGVHYEKGRLEITRLEAGHASLNPAQNELTHCLDVGVQIVKPTHICFASQGHSPVSTEGQDRTKFVAQQTGR